MVYLLWPQYMTDDDVIQGLKNEVRELTILNADRVALIQVLASTINEIERSVAGHLNAMRGSIAQLNAGVEARNQPKNEYADSEDTENDDE
jgi:hypothetical protein|tara:strand:- start:33 stop:305 length:273 start_codon:yes stop_codon:yes gene_type:complete